MRVSFFLKKRFALCTNCPLISARLIYFHLCCILLFFNITNTMTMRRTVVLDILWPPVYLCPVYNYCVCVCVCLCVCMHGCMCVCVHIHTCVCVCVYVCVHMLPPVYIKGRSMWVSFWMIHWLKQKKKSLMAGKRVSSLCSHKYHKQVKCNDIKWYALI